MQKKVLTLSYPLTAREILLGYKKRGFGEGKWNGFGGKVHDGETIQAAAVRELKEEAELTGTEDGLQKVAIQNFFFPDGAHLEVHTFFLRVWQGEPCETDEMRPAWFSYDTIPYDRMWVDDIHWLPRALSGEKLIGDVSFDESGDVILSMEWKSVESLP